MSRPPEVPLSLPPQIIDRRDEGSTHGFLLATFCRVCGETGVSLFRMGQEPRAYAPDERCPQCEVAGKLSYGTMQQAHALLSGHEWQFWFDDAWWGFQRCLLSQGVSVVQPRIDAEKSPSPSGSGTNAKVY